MNPNQGFQPPNQGIPSPQPYQPPHKRSLEDIVTQFVQTQQSTNTEFRIALNDVRSQITKLTSSIGNLQQEKRKLPSQPIQNPQGQNIVGSLGSSEGTVDPRFSLVCVPTRWARLAFWLCCWKTILKKTVWSRHLFLFYFKRENKIRKKNLKCDS